MTWLTWGCNWWYSRRNNPTNIDDQLKRAIEYNRPDKAKQLCELNNEDEDEDILFNDPEQLATQFAICIRKNTAEWNRVCILLLPHIYPIDPITIYSLYTRRRESVIDYLLFEVLNQKKQSALQFDRIHLLLAVMARIDCQVCLLSNKRDVYSSPFIRILLRCGINGQTSAPTSTDKLIIYIAKQMFMRTDVYHHIQYLYQHQDDERFGILLYTANRHTWIQQQLAQIEPKLYVLHPPMYIDQKTNELPIAYPI